MPPHISAIATFHSEGPLASLMLAGFDRIRNFSRKNGLKVELVAVLDCADAETTRIVKEHWAVWKTDQVLEVKYGCAAPTRNAGIQAARGQFIGIFDGDDYHTENWLVEAYRTTQLKTGKILVHPNLTVSFGEVFCVAKDFDMDSSDYSISSCFLHHPWTSSVFGEKKIFQSHPYLATKTKETGFGYEDWHWNLEVLASGVRHVAAPQTALFYRRNPSSRLARESGSRAIIRPSAFFQKPEFFLSDRSVTTPAPLSVRCIAEKAWLATTKPFMRVPPRKYRPSLNHSVKAIAAAISGNSFAPEPKDDRLLKAGILPQWAIHELQDISEIEPDLSPTPTLLSKFIFYAPPNEFEPGHAYGACLKELDGFQPDVIILVPWMTRGGADLGTLHHAKAAIACGKKVLVISTLEFDSPWGHRISELDGAKFLELGKLTKGLSEDRKLLILTRLLLQLPAQTIHTINSELGWKAIRDYGKCLTTLGKHAYASAFCEDIGEDGKPWGYARFYLADTLPNLTGFMCDTTWYPGELNRLFGVSTNKLYPVYFPSPVAPVEHCQTKLVKKVLWAGRPSKQKRVDLLLAIATACPDIQFVVHGVDADGFGYNNEIKTLVGKIHNLSNVALHNSKNWVAEVAAENDCAFFLYTSAWDGLPIVLLEATALGLPIIASAVGGVPEIISDETGYPVWDVDNVNAYVKQIRIALESPEERKMKWQKAATLVKNRHSQERFITTLKNIPYYLSPNPGASQ